MFDVTKLTMTIGEEDGQPSILIDPKDLYPAVLERIQEVLETGSTPSELMALTERGGNARAEILLATARALPQDAWINALIPRSEFYPDVPYISLDKRESLFPLIDANYLPTVQALCTRGDALELALGWFLHALRLALGGFNAKISKNPDYKL